MYLSKNIACFWLAETVLLFSEHLQNKGYFSLLSKQLAASHACTINGHLIGNNHFYLSIFKIGSCPWNKQLLVKPSGKIAWMFEDMADQCLQEVVHSLTQPTVGTHLHNIFLPTSINSARGFTLCLQVHLMHTLPALCLFITSYIVLESSFHCWLIQLF